ncbi:unnamed protein product [Larinioides sclopetarius]|uniref:Photosystem II protein T n=1 Tax=Larinioides sclopetarius TaxID=280406 RepID=A0AAV1ZVD9_9ARAC
MIENIFGCLFHRVFYLIIYGIVVFFVILIVRTSEKRKNIRSEQKSE